MRTYTKEVGLHSRSSGWSEVAIHVRSEVRVQVGLCEATAILEEWEESSILRKTSQAKPIGNVGVHCGQGVALNGTERVSNVDDLLELGNTWNLSSTEQVGELFECSNFELHLNLVDRLAVAGHANSKTVVGEGRVAILLHGTVNVGVVVVVVGKVPVGTIEADAVREQLDSVGGAMRWSAVGCR